MGNKPLLAILLFSLLSFSASGCRQSVAEPAVTCEPDESPDPIEGRTLLWSDEFDGSQGELPDPENWDYDLGTGWGNAQLEQTTNRPENVSTDGCGHLAIVARKENYMGRQYTSARIVTRGLREFEYGRIEARIKLPVGKGIWPAFWMLGNDHFSAGWPQCGEIDIMEYRGQEPSVNHGTLHGPGYSADQGVSHRFNLPDGQFNDAFHTFAIEWREDAIEWFVDDSLYHRVTPDDVSGEWVFDHPFYIILNIAVGGYFVGSPDPSTRFPQTMLVDYVRVYQTETAP